MDDDENLTSDVVFGVTDALIGDYRRHDDAEAPEPAVKAPWYSLDYTFVDGSRRGKTPRAADQVNDMAYPESLQNKVVLIVGGAGTIGGAAARMFASGGAKIVISYRGPEEARPRNRCSRDWTAAGIRLSKPMSWIQRR